MLALTTGVFTEEYPYPHTIASGMRATSCFQDWHKQSQRAHNSWVGQRDEEMRCAGRDITRPYLSQSSPCSLLQPASRTYWHRASSPVQAACGSADGRQPTGPWRLCCLGRAAGPSGSQPVPSQSHSLPGGPLPGGKGPSHCCSLAPRPNDEGGSNSETSAPVAYLAKIGFQRMMENGNSWLYSRKNESWSIKWKRPRCRKEPHLVQEAEREDRSSDGRRTSDISIFFRIKQVCKRERLRTRFNKNI